jgi:enoyl-CoA hydratase/carnithine racemase
LSKYDNDKDIGAIIITGSEKAFAGMQQISRQFI